MSVLPSHMPKCGAGAGWSTRGMLFRTWAFDGVAIAGWAPSSIGPVYEQAWLSAVSRNDEIALTMDYVKKGPFTCRPRPDVIANIAVMIAEFSAEKPDPMLTPKLPSFCRCWQ
eukprot:scaffold11562_cov132-Isochrysis_galbana.AAC.3